MRTTPPSTGQSCLHLTLTAISSLLLMGVADYGIHSTTNLNSPLLEHTLSVVLTLLSFKVMAPCFTNNAPLSEEDEYSGSSDEVNEGHPPYHDFHDTAFFNALRDRLSPEITSHDKMMQTELNLGLECIV